jgi:hypothetical protein
MAIGSVVGLLRRLAWLVGWVASQAGLPAMDLPSVRLAWYYSYHALNWRTNSDGWQARSGDLSLAFVRILAMIREKREV